MGTQTIERGHGLAAHNMVHMPLRGDKLICSFSFK